MSGSDFQIMKIEFQGVEKRLTDRFDRVDKDIADVKGKLDKIDDDIRENGRVGIIRSIGSFGKGKACGFLDNRSIGKCFISRFDCSLFLIDRKINWQVKLSLALIFATVGLFGSTVFLIFRYWLVCCFPSKVSSK